MIFLKKLWPLCFCVIFYFSISCIAQSQNAVFINSSVLVLSQDELFKKSNAGRALLEFFEQKQRELFSEARKIEKEFISEEKKLTEERLVLNVSEFQILADEFDIKVEKMRKLRSDKDRNLQQDFIQWKKNFVQIVLPIVREIMSQYKASVVLDTTIRGLIYDQKIDVTQVIIKRLNEYFLMNPLVLEEIILKN